MSDGRASVGVIYTGGTFGMVPSERGYVPSGDLPARAEAALAAGGDDGLPGLEWLDAGWPPVNSCDLVPRFWFDLAAVIARARDDHDGFVVIHGTDTLAYTGAALSFLLAGLGRPVVVTGASRPLGESGSDAPEHLAAAVRAAADGGSTEVMVAFGGRLLRANRTTKRHGSLGNPFTSPCWPPLADLNDAVRWHGTPAAPAAEGPVPRAQWHGDRVGLLAVHPGIDGATVRALLGTGVGALVLEGYAAGVGPGGDADFVAAIAEAVSAGVVCAAVSQAREGRVRLGRYAVSTPLAEAGLIGGGDMTREAALAKLHVLLAQRLSPAEVGAAFVSDLCGEITPED